MKRALLIFAFLLVACAPQTVGQTPVSPGNLQPYFTRTPSATPEEPEGLVVSFETPLPTSTPFVYEVQAGDTLSGIAFKFGVSLDELVAVNPDVSANSMSIGTELKIPSSPTNPTGASTSTPVPAPVEQIECYPTADRSMWCFVLVHNDTQMVIENLSARVTLIDAGGETLASAPSLSPLNILPPGASLPLMVFFPPAIPSETHPQVQLLTGIYLQPDDARYLPATLQNTLAKVDGSGRSAQVSGRVFLPADAQPASLVWVAAVAYDEFDRVVGVRRWESNAGITPGGNLEFLFEVSSLAGEIEKVEFVVEARP
jgi:LysM repeat protein